MLVATVTILCVIAQATCAIALLPVPEGAEDDFYSEEDARATLYLNSSILLLAALAAFGYVHVATRAPRPTQLHWHGVLLVLLLPEIVSASAGALFWANSMYMSLCLVATWGYASYGFRRVIFCQLAMKKLASIGAPEFRCFNAVRWGRLVVACTAVTGAGATLTSFSTALVFPEAVSTANDFWTLSGVNAIPTVLGAATAVGCLGSIVTSVGFVSAASHTTGAVLRKLAKRGVAGDTFTAARTCLRWHLYGLFSFIFSTIFIVLAQLVLNLNLVEVPIRAVYTSVFVVDWVGDLAGMMLSSGIGALLFKEDSEAGDLSSNIRSLLHAAVLTSRAGSVFEGKVMVTASKRCIASFPGKYIPEWNSMTWHCEQGELSSACVFLPKSDPKKRFGRHTPNPENPGECWCRTLYGCVQPWGCTWFETWRENIDEAVRLGLQLVVVYFPEQQGEGKVDWSFLSSRDLWDGVGLGGSQKAEVAYLERKGYSFLEEDIPECLQRMQLS